MVIVVLDITNKKIIKRNEYIFIAYSALEASAPSKNSGNFKIVSCVTESASAPCDTESFLFNLKPLKIILFVRKSHIKTIDKHF